jgi:tRNA(fMet)-specific endonuclease VapC
LFIDLWILDTDHLSLLQRGHSVVEQRIRNISVDDIAMTAIALSVNGILITRNQRDFAKVPNLVFEDWSTSM